MNPAPPFAWLVQLRDLPLDGLKIVRTLTEDECEALAANAGIEAVTSLTARGEVRPWADGVEVEISFAADVVQACVLTLEPVADHVVGEFTRRYSPSVQGSEAGEVDLSPDEDDPPELLKADAIDLGPAVAEELILDLNPYPRAPGASLPTEAIDEGAGASPFAVLERLKPKS